MIVALYGIINLNFNKTHPINQVGRIGRKSYEPFNFAYILRFNLQNSWWEYSEIKLESPTSMHLDSKYRLAVISHCRQQPESFIHLAHHLDSTVNRVSSPSWSANRHNCLSLQATRATARPLTRVSCAWRSFRGKRVSHWFARRNPQLSSGAPRFHARRTRSPRPGSNGIVLD